MELESNEVKDAPGVTTQASERPECPPGQLGIQKLTEKFTKMVTGAEGGPWPSGDGQVVDQLCMQDLHDLNNAVVSLKIISNAAVQRCCGVLDEREGRGFLAADLLGAELIHGSVAPTEGHEVGKQVEILLSEAKEADERLRAAAKTRRAKARDKARKGTIEEEEFQKKLVDSDVKFKADRAALWSRLVKIELPKGKVKVERERPAKEEPPTPSLDKQFAVAAEAAAAAEAAVRAAREAFNIPYSEAQRANARLLKLTVFPEHHWPIYLNPDEDDAPDGGDGPIRLKRLAQFEVWAAAKMQAGEKQEAMQEAIRAVEVAAAVAKACTSREREGWRRLARVRLRRPA
jgi:hypothetical protein